MKRKHITATEIKYIGKETNNIDEEVLQVEKPQVFVNYEGIKRKILELTPKQAGVKHRSDLKRIKDNIKLGKFNPNSKNIKKLLKFL